jgi:hypothetical protein
MPGQNVNEAWIEVSASEGWLVTYRIVPSLKGPVVAEVRVFPDPRSDYPTDGRWSGKAAVVPEGGVPARVLRALRVTDPIALFDEVLERWLVEYGEEETQRVFGRFGLEPLPETVPHRPGRSGRSDTYYVRWAAAYVDRIRSGSRHPVKDIAETPPVWMGDFEQWSRAKREAAVRMILYEARRRGLLSSAPVGKSGGELSRKALRLLKKLGATNG